MGFDKVIFDKVFPILGKVLIVLKSHIYFSKCNAVMVSKV